MKIFKNDYLKKHHWSDISEFRKIIDEKWFDRCDNYDWLIKCDPVAWKWRVSTTSNWKYFIWDDLIIKSSDWSIIFSAPQRLFKSVAKHKNNGDYYDHWIILEEYNGIFYLDFNEDPNKSNIGWLLNDKWFILSEFDWMIEKSKKILLKDWTILSTFIDTNEMYSYHIEDCMSELKILWKWFFSIDDKLYYNDKIDAKIAEWRYPSFSWWKHLDFFLEWAKEIPEWKKFIEIQWKKFNKKLLKFNK